MTTNKKHFLTLVTTVIFLLFALASKVTNVPGNAFDLKKNVEDPSSTDPYIVKNDGKKTYGKTIRWVYGLRSKNEITLDGQVYKTDEVMGYYFQNKYFARLNKNEYAMRVVHGKINVYVKEESGTRGAKMEQYYTAHYYAQEGEKGELREFRTRKEIKALVEDCSDAVDLINISSGKLVKALHENPDYVYNIFSKYNSGCK